MQTRAVGDLFQLDCSNFVRKNNDSNSNENNDFSSWLAGAWLDKNGHMLHHRVTHRHMLFEFIFNFDFLGLPELLHQNSATAADEMSYMRRGRASRESAVVPKSVRF